MKDLKAGTVSGNTKAARTGLLMLKTCDLVLATLFPSAIFGLSALTRLHVDNGKESEQLEVAQPHLLNN
jgi:hypothetical protein